MKNGRFKSSYKYTKELYTEFNKGLRWRERLYYLIIMVLIIITILLVGFIFFLDYHFVGFMSIILIILSVACIIMDRTSLNYKRMVESHNGKEPSLDIILTDNLIIGKDGKNKSEYSYDAVRRVVETNNLVILVLKYKLGITLDKRNLTGGNVKDLEKFLLKKCPNVKKVDQAKRFDKQYFELVLIMGMVLFFVAQALYVNDYKELTKIKEDLMEKYSLQESEFYFTHDEATLEMDIDNSHYIAYFYRGREKDFNNVYKAYSLDADLDKFDDNCYKKNGSVQCKFSDSDETYYGISYEGNFVRVVVSNEEIWTWLIVDQAVFGE